jgi:hypothetical protein
MKTLKTLLAAGVILVVSIVKSYASGNENFDQAYKQLNVQLKEVLKQSLTDKFNTSKNSCLVVLTFSVNDKHQIENVVVESSDDTYAAYIKKLLNRKKVEVDPLFDGKRGQIMIMMDNEG